MKTALFIITMMFALALAGSSPDWESCCSGSVWLDLNVTDSESVITQFSYGILLLSLVALLCFVNVLLYVTIQYLIQVVHLELKYPRLIRVINYYKKVNLLYIVVEAFMCLVCLLTLIFFSLKCLYSI